ncbi:hypothetical protein J2W91_005392 [Paenibacillus amylolyticus]|uniref:Uncharacterized protein n=1 Tax=Paenibacillus amylolyticus TaxID=1451 RepID=A0AAP5H8S7_PAEAM|nr:hypothetical protein [Paenibacillus amylolyticus]
MIDNRGKRSEWTNSESQRLKISKHIKTYKNKKISDWWG